MVAVNAEEEAFPSVDWPVTERVPLDVKEEVAVTVPKVGVALTLIVEVEVKNMLLPEMRYETGEL